MKRSSAVTLMIILLLSLTALWGCPKRAEVSSEPEEAPFASEAQPTDQDDAMMREGEDGAQERAANEMSGLQPVYFDFDRSFIRDDAKSVMQANAEWLKANPQTRVRIEGNCDDRGTIEYNQALGQRRAAAAKKYLTRLGISSRRISLISYGKEKPMCYEATEECWQMNRRDDFVVVNE